MTHGECVYRSLRWLGRRAALTTAFGRRRDRREGRRALAYLVDGDIADLGCIVASERRRIGLTVLADVDVGVDHVGLVEDAEIARGDCSRLSRRRGIWLDRRVAVGGRPLDTVYLA